MFHYHVYMHLSNMFLYMYASFPKYEYMIQTWILKEVLKRIVSFVSQSYDSFKNMLYFCVFMVY